MADRKFLRSSNEWVRDQIRSRWCLTSLSFFRAWVYQGIQGIIRVISDLRGACLLRSVMWEGWIIAVHKIRECRRRMGNETRRKNVMTEFSNVYSTYSTSVVFGYRSSRRVSNLQIQSSNSNFSIATLTLTTQWPEHALHCLQLVGKTNVYGTAPMAALHILIASPTSARKDFDPQLKLVLIYRPQKYERLSWPEYIT